MKFAACLRIAFVVVCAGVLCSQPSWKEQVGRAPDGSFMLPTGWRIQPVGQQVPLDTLPMSSILSQDGKFLLVLNGGYKPPSIAVFATASMNQIASVPVADGWLGLTWSPDGRRVYVGGGSKGRVYEFTFSEWGELKPAREFALVEGEATKDDFVGDVKISPDGQNAYVAMLYRDSIVVVNLQSGKETSRHKTGRRPYRILFHPDGKSYFVSSWADASVYHHETSSGSEITRIRLGNHTTDMVLGDRREDDAKETAYRLYVAAANTNSVFVVNVTKSKDLQQREVLNVAMTPRQPLGMTPSGLALSADQKLLYVACSDANVVAVADLTDEHGRLIGFIPTGWYPTAVRALADGRVLVLNGRGLGSFANPNGPSPIRRSEVHQGDARKEYVGNLQIGSMSVIAPLTEASLTGYTQAAQSLSPYRDTMLDVQFYPDDSVIYSKPGKSSPIQHVIYIVKENRTYDQIFGKIGKGNSDPSLCLFDEQSAPNHYKLAREFVLFDNFYVNADVSADGHNWSVAAIAPDYTQRLWPSNYASPKRKKNYDFEGGEPANTPPAGYIWNNVMAAGLSLRNYGYFVNNRKEVKEDGVQIDGVRDPALQGVTNTHYRGFDLDYPDVKRAETFLADLKEFESSGSMPRMLVMRMGNDHTSGAAAGKVAPLSSFADNDYALGMLVEAVSKSRFWATTAIFVLEDDAQNGPDHVDSHRSVMLALSPYTRRGIVDSSMYNTTSVLHSISLILGLRPMTHFDASSRPLLNAFAARPSPAPYVAEKPRMSLTERNPAATPAARAAEKMDLDEADEVDDNAFSAMLWEMIKKTPSPAPVRSFFSRQ